MPESHAGDTDRQLVERCQQGDAEAFEELVLRHRQAIYRMARRMTGSHAEADELTQDAFVRAYTALPRFRGDAEFRTWMIRIVMNLGINARQSRRRLVALEEIGPRPATSPKAFETTLRHEVRRAVETLSPRQKEVLLLKVYEGLKFSEVAEAAGMSVGTAKATFFQAVRNLRRRIGGMAPRGEREDVGT